MSSSGGGGSANNDASNNGGAPQIYLDNGKAYQNHHDDMAYDNDM